MKIVYLSVEKLKILLGQVIFFSRWALVPVYVSLVLLIFVYCLRFISITSSLTVEALKLDDKHLILETLNLIDMVMVVNLILMVLFGGYEIFVSKMRIHDHVDKPEWLTGITTSALKLRISLTIVTISSLEILKALINVTDSPACAIWLQIALHLTLLVSALIVAIIAKINSWSKIS
jgi:uncharacterized protein (TIGR00645 family)